MILVGSVVGETDRGINIFVPFPERIDKLYDCHSTVGVEFVDKRRIGQEDFLKRYIIEPVRIDERIAKVYRLKAR